MFAAGLDHVQLSVQAAAAANGDTIGGLKGGHAQKLAFAERVVALGLPLTLNAVIHRGNIGEIGDLIALAVELGAKRLEVAHTQYYGWAYVNRAALMPARADVDRSIAVVEEARERLAGTLVIDLVVPDYYARYPKACAGGWGRRLMNVTPSGKVLPCHAAETIPGLVFWSVSEHSLADIWDRSPAFEAFRGTDWMPEPCRSCERKEIDWGGCRCQALALAGDASATDPACVKSPFHARIRDLATSEASAEAPPAYRLPHDRRRPRARARGRKSMRRAFALVSLVLALGLGAAVAQTPPDPSDLLFDRPQWQAAQAGAALNYRYARKSPLADVFGDDIEDTIGLTLDPGAAPEARTVHVEHVLAETPPRRRPLRGLDRKPGARAVPREPRRDLGEGAEGKSALSQERHPRRAPRQGERDADDGRDRRRERRPPGAS